MAIIRKILRWGLLFFLSLLLNACAVEELDSVSQTSPPPASSQQTIPWEEDEFYYDMEDVAGYLHYYQSLPDNYILKAEADRMGWSPTDDTWVVGGDRFYNREGQLPQSPDRLYFEADLQAGYSHHRGPERLVYSNDGLIFYTPDHYDSFVRLY